MQDWQKQILKKEEFNKQGPDQFQPLKNQTMKNNKTKVERVEEQITLFLMIIGLAYFVLMASRLFFNF